MESHLQKVVPYLYADLIFHLAKAESILSGTCLFHYIPEEAKARVFCSSFNPRDKCMSVDELEAWVEAHLIFGHTDAVIKTMQIHDGDVIIWERKECIRKNTTITLLPVSFS